MYSCFTSGQYISYTILAPWIFSKNSNSHSSSIYTNVDNILLILVRPLRVDFLYNGTAMSVNQDYQLTCLAIGSEPSAVITWWIDDVMIPTNHYITEVTLWFEDFIYDISNHYWQKCPQIFTFVQKSWRTFWSVGKEKR